MIYACSVRSLKLLNFHFLNCLYSQKRRKIYENVFLSHLWYEGTTYFLEVMVKLEWVGGQLRRILRVTGRKEEKETFKIFFPILFKLYFYAHFSLSSSLSLSVFRSLYHTLTFPFFCLSIYSHMCLRINSGMSYQ